MKISRICLVGALIMALVVAWTVATPVQLNGKDSVGGSCQGSCKSNSPSYQCTYTACGYFHTCLVGSGMAYTCYDEEYCTTGSGCGPSTMQMSTDCRGAP